MRSFAIISLVAGLAGLTRALDPDSVSLSDRTQWCFSQTTQCPLLCLQYPGDSASTITNECDADTLSYSCVCGINGLSPNASEYSLTIPYFICTETNNQCVRACGQNNVCANDCRTQNPCGAQNPTRVNTSTITSTMSKTAASSSDPTASGSQFSNFDSQAENKDNKSGNNASQASTMHIAQAVSALSLVGVALVGLQVLF